jgi:hypothetical protein
MARQKIDLKYEEHNLLRDDGSQVIIINARDGRRGWIKILKPEGTADYFSDYLCEEPTLLGDELYRCIRDDPYHAIHTVFMALASQHGLDRAKAEFNKVLTAYSLKEPADFAILKKYAEMKGNKSHTAKALNMDPRHVRRVINKYRKKIVFICMS